MAPRYRKIFPHMWADAKVQSLSRPDPNAQTLWVHLLAGEQTEFIPGVFRIGEAAFAEQLGWSVEGFRKPFRELFAKGMVKADWISRLVWVPNALKWNAPDNPNIIKGWAEQWRHTPECDLKHEVWQAFKRFIEPLGKGFAEAFAEALPEPSAKSEIREQRAEIRDLDPQRDEKPKTPSAPVAAAPGYAELVALWFAEYEGYYGKKPPWSAVHGRKLKEAMAQSSVAELSTLIPHFFAWQRPEVIKGGHSLWKGYASFIAKLDELRADIAKPQRRAIAAVATDRERIDDSQAQNAAQSQRVLRALEEKRNAIGNGQGRADLGSGAHARGDLQPPAIGLGVDGVDGRAVAPARAGADAVAQGRVPATAHAGPGRHHRDDAGGEEA